MGPIPFDVKDMMGGGLGALWAGQDKALDQGLKDAQTQNFLEQIAASQQTRDFNTQMNPLKIQEQQYKNQELPLNMEEKRLKNQEARGKLNRENTVAAMDTYMRFVSGNPVEDAALLKGISKQYGIPEDHPILGVMAQQYAKAGPKGIQALSSRIASGGMKETEQRTREGFLLDKQTKADDARMARLREEEAGKDRRLKEQLAIKLRLEAKRGNDAIKIKDFQTAMLAYTAAYEAARDAGDEAAAKQALTLLNQAREMANTAAGQKQAGAAPFAVPGVPMTPLPQFGGPGQQASQGGSKRDPLNLGL